jgi:glutamine---fructose-6-phosphate transaminase (isomerizing)
MMTDMAREIVEIPAAVERLLANREPVFAAARTISRRSPRFAVVCGRGSSGHVATYLRYLIETRLGIVVSFVAPSVFTTYDRRPSMADSLFIVVSQSGQSPDLVTALSAARRDGAITIAIVNETRCPVADAADMVVAVNAGPELAVAATKSVVNSLVACTDLIASSCGDADLLAAASRLPARLAQALSLDWSAWGDALREARAAFVVGRGYGLGIARELALKLGETIRVPALAYSAAELRHGPQAALASNTPILALRQADATAATVDDLCSDLRNWRLNVFVAGGSASGLPWLGDDHPACDVVCMLVPAYRTIERVARATGCDPDRPPFLSKVTRTL